MAFNFYNPTKMIFGCGKLELVGEEVKKYGNSCLLVTTPNSEAVLRPLYDRVKAILDRSGIRWVHFDEVVPNPDVKGIAKAIQIVREQKLEVILGVGGGSSLDTCKSIALFWELDDIDWNEMFQKYSSPFEDYALPGTKALPVVAVPTTAGTGSEMTQAMIVSDHEKNDKECVYHRAVFPKAAIIDPELTRTLPVYPTAITGFDAFTHSFESYMREDHASVYTMTLGKLAMSEIIRVLPKLLKDPQNMEYREAMSQAASFSGISLSNASATIPHPLSEVIGGVVPRIAHGQCLACLYPGFLRFQITKTPERCADVARLFDASLEKVSDQEAAAKLPELVEAFLKEIGLNKTLKELGVTEEQYAEMRGNFVFNVLPFAPKDTLLAILESSYSGV